MLGTAERTATKEMASLAEALLEQLVDATNKAPPWMHMRLFGKMAKQPRENDRINGALLTKKTSVRHMGRRGRRRNLAKNIGVCA